MDALGTAVGVASLGIQICQGLLSYYDGWKGYYSDISSTYESIADLAHTFIILRAGLTEWTGDGKSKGSFEGARVDTCLNSSTEGLRRLQKRLSKLQTHSEPQGLRQKTWAELQRAWYPFRASTLAELKKDVSELRGNLSLALQVLQQATVARGFEQTADRISQILIDHQATKRKKIIDWLSPPDPYYNHNAARRKHEPGTGTWLLQCNEYKSWHTSSSTVLWLTGTAGCGKTVLCSTVIEDIRARCQAMPDAQFAFFYFSFSDTQKQSYTGLLSSLVTQLLHNHASFQYAQQAFYKTYPSKLSTEALENLFLVCLQQRSQTLLVIDALDELPEGDDDGRRAIIHALKRVMQTDWGVRVFVTSRRLVDIENSIFSLGARPVLVHPELANHDIQKHVSAELDKHPKLCAFSADVKEKIKRVFEEKAGGVFRWVFYQLEALKSLRSTRRKHVEEALHRLPRTLDETYERMLLQVGDDYHEEALAALRWLTFEARPLTLAELWEAYLIRYEDGYVEVDDRGQPEDVLEILAGLVTVEEQSAASPAPTPGINSSGPIAGRAPTFPISTQSRIRLAHFSIKEYLVSDRILAGGAAHFALRQDRDQQILAQSCLAYILHCSRSGEISRKDLNTSPLLKYAAKIWTTFISKNDQVQPGYEVELLDSEQHRRNWLALYEPDRPWKGPFDPVETLGTGIYYAAYIGLFPALEALLQKGRDVNARGGRYGNPLQAASMRGHGEAVKLLLEHGANVNALGGSYRNALHAASQEGHRVVVKLLIENGANVDGQRGAEALYAASEEGYQEVVKLLLAAGAQADAHGGLHGTALQAALRGGHQDVMKLLLDAGSDVNAQGRYGTALQAASEKGYQDMVTLLLDAGADVNAQGGIYCDALCAASQGGSQEVVKLLLAAGADVNAPGGMYGAALQVASRGGYRDVVRLLLDAGADVDTYGGMYGTALCAASSGGYRDVVRLLLDAGADIDAQGGIHRNALDAVSKADHKDVVRLLLGAGAHFSA